MCYKLMPEYGCSPVWKLSDQPAENIPIFELPVSEDLRASLEKWDEMFQSTFDASYPPNSGFANPKDAEAFLRRGETLVEELGQELPDADIEYERVEVQRKTSTTKL